MIQFTGVIINENLNWGSLIDKVITKLASINGVLYNIRNSLPVNIRKQIYFALVNSCLMYALSVWGCGGNISVLIMFLRLKKELSERFLAFLK